MRWLVVSVALSAMLTVLLNAALRAFPDAGHRVARRLAELTSLNTDTAHGHDRPVRVFVPWKAMILVSALVTIGINVILWII